MVIYLLNSQKYLFSSLSCSLEDLYNEIGQKNGNKGKTSLTWFGVIGESSDTRHQGVQEWEAVCFLVEETSTFSQKVGDFC